VRKITRVPLKEAFFSGMRQRNQKYSGPRILIYRYLFNATSFAIGLWVILLMTSVLSHTSWVLFVAFSAFLGYRYFTTREVAQSILINRKSLQKKIIRQGDKTHIQYELINASPYDVTLDFTLEDHFSASLDSFIAVSDSLELKAREKKTIEVERTCDADMGLHFAGPLCLKLRDDLGIFEFQITEDQVAEFELIPRIKQMAPLNVRGSDFSPFFGLYDVSTRGLSVNFSGVRPFSQGDSLRHVAWKIFSKRQELVVKEFEKSVSADVSIVLNLDPQLQLKLEKSSSWEQIKHLALSVSQQQLSLGNSIRIFSSDWVLSPSRGDEFIEFLAKRLSRIRPQASSISQSRSYLLQKVKDEIPAMSTLVFITVFELREFEQDFQILKFLQSRGIQIFVLMIDSSSYLSELNESLEIQYQFTTRTRKQIFECCYRLKSSGMEVAILEDGENLTTDSFFQHHKTMRVEK
jgi:uncharacterized protein (DUF58 family)